VGIYAALATTSKGDVLREHGGAQFSTFKAALIELAVAKLGPINAEMKRLVADPVHIDSLLADGAARAQIIAAETMKAVKDIVGFVRR
jgi:tryptophanyl-tRNA synthetase